MSILYKLAAAAALSLPLMVAGAPVAAGSQPGASREIVVTASPREVALRDWSKRIQSSLENRMARASSISPVYFQDEGLAQVRFECSDSGKPAAVTLAQTSGNPRVDRAALRAVRMISLHQLPEGMKSDQQVLAQLLFLNAGASERDTTRRVKAMQEKAARHNQWFYRDEIASGAMLLIGAAQ